MYHEVAPVPRAEFLRFTVTAQAFDWQMGWLARSGFAAVSLDQLLAARRLDAELPRRPVVITFDDGFADSARFAPPVLARHGYTATFYLVAGLMGQSSEWMQREVGMRLPLMSWTTARSLRDAGFGIGSHTVSHPRLAELPADAARAELVRSREILEQGLARSIEHLAYPYGSHSAEVQQLTREAGYQTACTTLEARSRGEDVLALCRVPVYGTDSRLDFASRVLTARALVPLVRGAVHAVKQGLGQAAGARAQR